MGEKTSGDILAANVRQLIERDTQAGARPSTRGWALRKGLDVKLVERLVKNSHSVTLETLNKVADACGLAPWQLLLEDFDPGQSAPPLLTPEDRQLMQRLRHLLGDNPPT